MTSDREPRAIPTHWAGYRFRSRTEARVAVFLQTLGLRWEYEPQGFIVKPGHGENCTCPTEPYLPDFHVPEIGLWLEVKPTMADLVDPNGVRVWENFAGMVEEQWDAGKAVMWLGGIPNPDEVDRLGPPRAQRWYDPGLIGLGQWHLSWCACPTGQHFDVQEEARGGRIECGCPRIADGRARSGNHPTILTAYRAARSARFEHGEKPAA